jgi:acetolactate synthase-1/2/3 large subunit
MNGSEWLARALAGTGMTHVFFVESVLRRTLLELGDLGVIPILAHSEKAAAYMADGYARVAGRPGVCMAQSVGAANLASGLQDPYLGRSPVIALTGRKEPSFQHRNSYQEVAHAPLFAAVTKFSTPVDSTSELPRLLRHAWRAALADPPRPTHLDLCGLQGDVIELGQTTEPPTIDPEMRRIPAHRPVAHSADIERAAAALIAARRVAIVAGEGLPLRRRGRSCSPWPRRWRRRWPPRSARAASFRPHIVSPPGLPAAIRRRRRTVSSTVPISYCSSVATLAIRSP